MVAFGLAPPITLYAAFFAESGAAGLALCFLPVAAGAVRLSRHTDGRYERGDFTPGLPIPAAATLQAGYVALAFWLWGEPRGTAGAIVCAVAAAFLMVCSVPYESDRYLTPHRILRSWRGRIYLVSVVTVLAWPSVAFFFWACVFAGFGVARRVIARG